MKSAKCCNDLKPNLVYVSSSLISSFSAASRYGVPSGVLPLLEAPCDKYIDMLILKKLYLESRLD